MVAVCCLLSSLSFRVPPTIAPSAGQTNTRLDLASLAALFCIGVYAAAFGPVLPFLAHDLDVSLDTAGLVLSMLFAGSIAASGAIAVVLHAHDARRLTIAGLLSAFSGLLLLGLAPAWTLALAGGIVLGLGDGLMIAALHMLVAQTARDVPAAMQRLNLYFAFGAVAGAIWAGAVLATTGERAIVYAGIAAAVLLTLALLLSAPRPDSWHAGVAGEEFRLPGNPTAWVMGAILFLYVGAEFGLGSWVSSYARETAGAGVFAAATLTAGYWAALAGGRVIASAYVARGHHSSALLAAGVAGTGVASVLLAVVSGNIYFSAVAAFAAGLCLGPVWPATLTIAAEAGMPNATATTVTMGNAGGLAIPWLQGRVLVGAGPRQGVAVTAVLCVIMFGASMWFRLARPHEDGDI